MAEHNKLELYLHDVFEKECNFKIPKAETEFIQKGIETVVQKIADRVLENDDLQADIKRKFEICFKGNITKCPEHIFGAGSYYEGTKNNFPDEFDLILALYCCHGDHEQYKKFLLEASVFDTVSGTFTQTVKDLLDADVDALHYTDGRKNRKLYFEKHLSQHGPATWLRFIYENESQVKQQIDVDYVAALIVNDKSVLRHAIEEYCAVPQFAKESMSIGSCFCIGANFSFTLTEVHIMKNILSEKHRKIYRILKFLINGHGDVEVLGNKLGTFEKPYSSYMIKSVMIYHHYSCGKPDTIQLGPCILDIMDDMCKYKDTKEFPRLYKTDHRIKLTCDLCLRGHLRSLTDSLRNMQKHSGKNYEYEKDKMKMSLSKRYLNDK